jgi:GNAT superfamily N-acetyltransferase
VERADLPDLADLITAVEHVENPFPAHNLLDPEAAFDTPGADPWRNAVVLRDPKGNAVAFGWNVCPRPEEQLRRVFLITCCHPGWRNRGVRLTLLGWQVERAREWYAETCREGMSPLEMVVVADGHKLGDVARLARAGFVAQRWMHDLHLSFGPDGLPWVVPEIPGVRIVAFDPSRAEEIRRVHNECFRGRPGARPVQVEEWQDSLEAPAVRPDLSWIALAGDDVVGYVINAIVSGDPVSDGWTERLGALPRWRTQGLLTSLLATTLNSFRDAGFRGAGIGVDTDSPTGSRPYEALGYTVLDTVVWYVHRGTIA